MQLQCLFILTMHLQSINSFLKIFENSNQISWYFPWISLCCMTSDFSVQEFPLKIAVIMWTLCGISFINKHDDYLFPYEIFSFISTIICWLDTGNFQSSLRFQGSPKCSLIVLENSNCREKHLMELSENQLYSLKINFNTDITTPRYFLSLD